MSEVETAYRAAPRQSSPARLDSLILARAARERPAKPRIALAMSPWKTAAASFCVVGLGVALLMRFGVPPLSGPSNDDSLTEIASVGLESVRPAPIDGVQKDLPVAADDIGRSERESIQQAETSTFKDSQAVEGPLAQTVSADSLAESQAAVTLPQPDLDLAQQGESDVASVAQDGIAIVLNGEMSAEDVGSSSTAAAQRSSSADKLSAEPVVVVRSPSRSVSLAVVDMLVTDEAQGGQQRLRKSRAAENKVETMQIDGQQSRGESALVVAQTKPAVVDAAGWIANQSPFHFTLVLGAASDADYLQKLGLSLDLQREWAIVELKNGQFGNNFALVYGVFEAANQALEHLKSMDIKATELDPRVRSFKNLRSEAKLP